MPAVMRMPPRPSASSRWSAARLRELFTAPWVFPLILSVALAIRVGHISALRSTLWFDHLDLDPRYFDEWGSRIAAGDWMGSRVFFVDPLYPYLLGALYWLFGHHLLLDTPPAGGHRRDYRGSGRVSGSPARESRRWQRGGPDVRVLRALPSSTKPRSRRPRLLPSSCSWPSLRVCAALAQRGC